MNDLKTLHRYHAQRIAVITQAPFPVGNVSTMRIISYLKSLVKIDIYAYVLVYCPTRMASGIQVSEGVYEGINFQYATDITWKKYNLLYKIVYLLKGLFNSLSYLKSQNISTIILYGDNLFIVNLFYWLYTRLKGIRYIGDRSELPLEKIRKSCLKLYFYGLKQKMFDGIIVMTKRLVQFYSRYSSKQDYLFMLPMTIDSERFQGVQKVYIHDHYIATVFGTHNRDGLFETIKSFEIYCKKGGSFNLRLIGDFENMPNKSSLESLINNSDYKSRIIILGKQANEVVPSILFNASVLVTTPNYYSSGGFPTKLGEYMLSGVPIVATDVGEVSNYIIPDVDMLLCKPGDIEGISSAMLMLERNSNFARKIALNAERKAKDVFCADSYINELVKFLFK